MYNPEKDAISLQRRTVVDMDLRNRTSDMAESRLSSRLSCERCRRRKIRCDRDRPCSHCKTSGSECAVRGNGHKSRPVSRKYVEALEKQIAELQSGKIARESHSGQASDAVSEAESQSMQASEPQQLRQEISTPCRPSRTGRLRRKHDTNMSQFFGGTSLFQAHRPVVSFHSRPRIPKVIDKSPGITRPTNALTGTQSQQYRHAPNDLLCRQLLASFFQHQYQYNMCIYREYFLRDYDAGAGPYYSTTLLYAICSTASLASDMSENLTTSADFAKEAERRLQSELERPTLTTLQALLLLGHCAIGRGQNSKGWLYCGMAFRLTHEMGLHLDPGNWNGSQDCPREREILRRVYWASFIADKQLSLYFGRPSALYPHESDVRNTIRIQYPGNWEALLNKYISANVTPAMYEDGVALVGSFIYHVELAKIMHTMIAEVFENRSKPLDDDLLRARRQGVHNSLLKWLSSLPTKLHWNPWTLGPTPAQVLHLHMLFHTTMIVLHRISYEVSSHDTDSDDAEVCHGSFQAILSLLRTYRKYYSLKHLPLDFVYTLTVVASTLLPDHENHSVNGTPALDPAFRKGLDVLLEAMGEIETVWPCVYEIRASIASRLSETPAASLQEEIEQECVVGPALMDHTSRPDTSCETIQDGIVEPFMDDDSFFWPLEQSEPFDFLVTDEMLMTDFDWGS